MSQLLSRGDDLRASNQVDGRSENAKKYALVPCLEYLVCKRLVRLIVVCIIIDKKLSKLHKDQNTHHNQWLKFVES